MIQAWHFLRGEHLRDGRKAPPDGEWLRHEGKCLMCIQGLHASRRAIDALKWAPGETLCRVEVRDVAHEDSDKLVAHERRIIWRLNAAPPLRAFARHVALEVIDWWKAPEVVVRYLCSGDESLRAAARDAARDAAWAAARDAASAVARDAAWDAASYAAWAAAWAAAGGAQEELLQAYIREARSGITEWELYT